MKYAGDCEQCGDPVYTNNAAYPITGWEVSRAGGGANQIKYRERTPNIVCHPTPCLDKLIREQQQGGTQGSLM